MLSHITQDFLHLFFPHHCEGCHTDVLHNDQLLCAACKDKLPETGYCITPHNPVEKIFYGRLPVQAAAAAWHFTKASLLQHLMFQLKYRNNPGIGVYLGKLLGYKLKEAAAFSNVDVLVPMPLHPKKATPTRVQPGTGNMRWHCCGVAQTCYQQCCYTCQLYRYANAPLPCGTLAKHERCISTTATATVAGQTHFAGRRCNYHRCQH